MTDNDTAGETYRVAAGMGDSGRSFAFTPFDEQTPYEVIGMNVDEGVAATAREIGHAAKKVKRKAQRLKDTKERARRMEAIDAQKDCLIRPDDRVMVDFFLIGRNVLGDVCNRIGDQIRKEDVPTQELIGAFYPHRKYDELIPRSLDQFESNFLETGPQTFQDEPGGAGDTFLPLIPGRMDT